MLRKAQKGAFPQRCTLLVGFAYLRTRLDFGLLAPHGLSSWGFMDWILGSCGYLGPTRLESGVPWFPGMDSRHQGPPGLDSSILELPGVDLGFLFLLEGVCLPVGHRGRASARVT